MSHANQIQRKLTLEDSDMNLPTDKFIRMAQKINEENQRLIKVKKLHDLQKKNANLKSESEQCKQRLHEIKVMVSVHKILNKWDNTDIDENKLNELKQLNEEFNQLLLDLKTVGFLCKNISPFALQNPMESQLLDLSRALNEACFKLEKVDDFQKEVKLVDESVSEYDNLVKMLKTKSRMLNKLVKEILLLI